MDFIRQLMAFDDLSNQILTPNATTIYLKLFMMDNRLHWEEWFEATDRWLMMVTGIKRPETIKNAVNLLKQRGFIECIRGGDGKPTKYRLVLLNSRSPSRSPSTSPSRSPSTSPSTSLENLLINNKKIKSKKVKVKESDAFASVISPALKKALLDFEDMRKKIKAPMTDRAKELLIAKLEELSGGDDVLKVKMLEQSIERGWKTVYTIKDDWREVRNGDNRSNGGGDNGEMSEWERAEMWQKQHRPWDLQSNAGGAGA